MVEYIYKNKAKTLSNRNKKRKLSHTNTKKKHNNCQSLYHVFIDANQVMMLMKYKQKIPQKQVIALVELCIRKRLSPVKQYSIWIHVLFSQQNENVMPYHYHYHFEKTKKLEISIDLMARKGFRNEINCVCVGNRTKH